MFPTRRGLSFCVFFLLLGVVTAPSARGLDDRAMPPLPATMLAAIVVPEPTLINAMADRWAVRFGLTAPQLSVLDTMVRRLGLPDVGQHIQGPVVLVVSNAMPPAMGGWFRTDEPAAMAALLVANGFDAVVHGNGVAVGVAASTTQLAAAGADWAQRCLTGSASGAALVMVGSPKQSAISYEGMWMPMMMMAAGSRRNATMARLISGAVAAAGQTMRAIDRIAVDMRLTDDQQTVRLTMSAIANPAHPLAALAATPPIAALAATPPIAALAATQPMAVVVPAVPATGAFMWRGALPAASMGQTLAAWVDVLTNQPLSRPAIAPDLAALLRESAQTWTGGVAGASGPDNRHLAVATKPETARTAQIFSILDRWARVQAWYVGQVPGATTATWIEQQPLAHVTMLNTPWLPQQQIEKTTVEGSLVVRSRAPYMSIVPLTTSPTELAERVWPRAQGWQGWVAWDLRLTSSGLVAGMSPLRGIRATQRQNRIKQLPAQPPLMGAWRLLPGRGEFVLDIPLTDLAAVMRAMLVEPAAEEF